MPKILSIVVGLSLMVWFLVSEFALVLSRNPLAVVGGVVLGLLIADFIAELTK